MVHLRVVTYCLCAWICLPVFAFSAERESDPSDADVTAAALPATIEIRQVKLADSTARVNAVLENGRMRRLYGEAFSNGASAQASARAFLERHAGVLDVPFDDLRPGAAIAGGGHLQPLMYERQADRYRFTAVLYEQHRAGIPVVGSRLVLLVRNETNFPLVLAASDLRPLGAFDPVAASKNLIGEGPAREIAKKTLGEEEMNTSQPSLVIWAGTEHTAAPARLAYDVSAVTPRPLGPAYRYVIDAQTGAVLQSQTLVHHLDVSGQITGFAVEGTSTDVCHPTAELPLPSVEILVDGESQITDEDGGFSLTDVPRGATLSAKLHSPYFEVFNDGGEDAAFSITLESDEDVPIVFNDGDIGESERAEVTAYYYAHQVRNMVLEQNPAYPTILDQSGFKIDVNFPGSCNAGYVSGGPTILLFASSDECPNTAHAEMLYHEYGHHLVQVAGSGQGQYGEGLGDSIAVIMTDDHVLCEGWNYDCDFGLRDADNEYQYPCLVDIHECGNVLSGCVWDLRNELVVTEPDNYLDILRSLTINSILLHTGVLITPSITIDFLTLDDDNATIFDGTPHYQEIATAFAQHNMDAPGLAFAVLDFPDGLPEFVSPTGTTVLPVQTSAVLDSVAEEGVTMVVIDEGRESEVPLDDLGDGAFEAVFPSTACGNLLSYYFLLETESGDVQEWPVGAPDELFTARAATGTDVVFSDQFEDDLGWTIESSASNGQWDRDVPILICLGGQPTMDADGSGTCYLTDNQVGGFPPCDNDIDNGSTTLTSPIMDASLENIWIEYDRWFTNTLGGAPETDVFEIQVSDDGGDTWTTLETVGPAGAEVDGGWFRKSFRVAEFIESTEEFRIRFIASDAGDDSTVEAAVDALTLVRYFCDTPCPADLDGDNSIGAADLAQLLGAWGPCAGCPADLNGNDIVDAADLAQLLGSWGPCP